MSATLAALLPCALGMAITVCTGSACSRNGGGLLLEAALALSPDDEPRIKGVACCSHCPSSGVVIRDEDDASAPLEKQPASYTAQAMTSAAQLVERASGATPSKSLVDGFTAMLDAREEARPGGDAKRAVELFTKAIDAAPGLEPTQPPPEPAPLEWEGSEWEEEAFGSRLTFDDSITTFEFGSCADGNCVLSDCVSASEEELSGSFELSCDEAGVAAGYGEATLSMAPDGRSFEGLLTDEAGEEHAWRGSRRLPKSETGQEEPPPTVAWVYESLLGRARARIKLGDRAAAAEDAEAATRLCCRSAPGWLVLAEAAGGEAADEPRREHAWLVGGD